MAAHVERPVIMPMSNPTSLSEAFPEDLIGWTEGRALVATGSPFPPVPFRGVEHEIAQVNNALVFPGLGLGAIVVRATRITDGMLLAAAEAVASLSDPSRPGASLLPRVSDLREVSAVVATAVARQAITEDVAAAVPGGDLEDLVRASMWRSEYHPVRAV
jgi:malate dehydrogenase (oxaloacetate-decarboxylating)